MGFFDHLILGRDLRSGSKGGFLRVGMMFFVFSRIVGAWMACWLTSPLGLHGNEKGGRLRTTDAALEYLWAGTGRRAYTWMTTGAGPIVTSQFIVVSGTLRFACFTSTLDPGVLAKTHTNTDTRGRPHHEHGVESIAWHRDVMETSRRMLHTRRRCKITRRQEHAGRFFKGVDNRSALLTGLHVRG